MIALALLGLFAALLGLLLKWVVCGRAAVAPAELKGDEAAMRVASKAAAIRVLEQLDVSRSGQGAPPSCS